MPGSVYNPRDKTVLRQCGYHLVDEWCRHIVAATEGELVNDYGIPDANVYMCPSLDEDTRGPKRASRREKAAAAAAMDDDGDDLGESGADGHSQGPDDDSDCESSDECSDTDS